MALVPVSCDEVSNVQFTWNAGTATLTVFWTSTGTLFTVRYRHLENAWTVLTPTATLSKSIAGLTPGNQYEIEIVNSCGGGNFSAPVNVGYIIPLAITPPSNLVIDEYSDTQIKISWSGPSVEYYVGWIEEGDVDADLEYVTVTANTYHIRDLDPHKRYRVMVWRQQGQGAVFMDTYIDKSEVCCVQSAI